MTTLLTRKDVASRLALSMRQVDRLLMTGRLRSVRIRTSVRVRDSDLEEYIKSLTEVVS